MTTTTKTGCTRFDLSDLRAMCDTMTAAECKAKIVAVLDAEAKDWGSRMRERSFSLSGWLWVSGIDSVSTPFALRFANEPQKPIKGREFGHGDTVMVIDGECCSCRIDRLTVIG